MVELSGGSVLGNSIEFSELGTGFEKWELLETMTFSSDTTKTSDTLTAYGRYKVVYRLTAGSTVTVNLRLNGDSSGNYTGVRISQITLEQHSGSSAYSLSTADSIIPTYGIINIQGIVPSGRSYLGIVASGTGGTGGSRYRPISGIWAASAGTQVETITIMSTAALTGTVEIYGAD